MGLVPFVNLKIYFGFCNNEATVNSLSKNPVICFLSDAGAFEREFTVFAFENGPTPGTKSEVFRV